MFTPFSRTLRALDADRRGHGRALAIAGLLLAAWGGWFLLGRVTMWESTRSARLEVDQAARAR